MEVSLDMSEAEASGTFLIRPWSKLIGSNRKVSSGELLELGGSRWYLDVSSNGHNGRPGRGYSFDVKVRCPAFTGNYPDLLPYRMRIVVSILSRTKGMAGNEHERHAVVTQNGHSKSLTYLLNSEAQKKFLSNDQMTIQLSVSLPIDRVKRRRLTSGVAAPSSSLAEDLNTMRKEGKQCDIEIDASGECLHAHRLVLMSRSPVFAAMLEANMAEQNTGTVKVTDIDRATLSRMLDYIYTDLIQDTNFASDSDAVSKLLQAGAKYQLLGLMSLCEEAAMKLLTVDSVVDWWLLACRLGDPAQSLKEQCRTFISVHLSAVRATKRWKEMMQDPLMTNELCSLLLEEVAA